jgi:hypothetical protein
MADSDDNFFSRWSRRKVQVREGLPVAPVPETPPAPALESAPKSAPKSALHPALPVTNALPAAAAAEAATAPPTVPAPTTPAAPPPPPAPTLADVARLTTQSDYTRFVARDVAPEVKNAALKKLFTDPQFNVMDGLDIYIDDYGKPDPLPAGMLRQMVQSQALRLFADEDEAEAAKKQLLAPPAAASPDADALPAPALPVADTDHPHPTPCDEDTAVQLQPDDDAGRACPEPGAGEDARRQH